jgi:hypothetical protein
MPTNTAAGDSKAQALLTQTLQLLKKGAIETPPPGNAYVTVSQWIGSGSNGTLSSSALVSPNSSSDTIISAGMGAVDLAGSGGAGGADFLGNSAGSSVPVVIQGTGSGDFTSVVLGLVSVNEEQMVFTFSTQFSSST